MDYCNQDVMFLEKFLDLLVGVLYSVGIELEDVAGRVLGCRWRGWRWRCFNL